MKIQYISLQKANYSSFTCSSFKDFQTLDSFDGTIIDLSAEDIWKHDGYENNDIDCSIDLKSLFSIVSNSKKKNIFVILPCNLYFRYNNRLSNDKYSKKALLSNMKSNFLYILREVCYLPERITIDYENNKNSLGNNLIVSSDFYFDKHIDFIHPEILSIDSEKNTAICDSRHKIHYCFLKLDSEEKLVAYLNKQDISVSSGENPQWLDEIDIFNDIALKNDIAKCNAVIQSMNNQIKDDNNRLKDNMFYKEMYVQTGDELAKRVFKSLEELLSINLSSFVDKKEADFIFDYRNVTFIGEIKGVSKNVSNENITQVDIHESRYLDQLQEEKQEPKPIKKILVINHQRSKPLSEREEVHINQIKLAEKRDVLIIEITTLINLLERFRKQEIDSDYVVNLLINNNGILH